MTKVHIGAQEVGSPLSAELEPGGALLIGRAPDPSRIHWASLVEPKTSGEIASGPLMIDRYQLQMLTVSSGQVSANHLLVLAQEQTAALYDLGSRNGSFMQLVPQRPLIIPRESELFVTLAGRQTKESDRTRPQDASWQDVDDFGPSIVAALSNWFKDSRIPVRVVRHKRNARSDGFLLADDTIIALEEFGTLPVTGAMFVETVSDYVHAQNARYWQLQRRVTGMIAASPAIRQVLVRTAESAANCRRTLFLGPTGVGKELLARSYHSYSPRHAGSFVTVNCALLEKDLLYAQLFGARRGSFTGAVADVPGLIEAAHGGTLFLDELGEMDANVQKALLRFLDSRGEYYRLGDSRPRHADVQVVGASNVPLDDPSYRTGRFRDDLWYRLAGSVITVPPLIERPEDVRAYLQSRTLQGSKWTVAECLTEDAFELVLTDPWPGNFRDLENFIDRLPRGVHPRSIDRTSCRKAMWEGRPKVPANPSARSETPAPQSILGPAPGTVSAPSHPGELNSIATVRAASSPPAATEVPARGSARLREQSIVPTNTALGWERIVNVALGTFLEDQGEHLTGWDQLQLYIEHYLKPMFIAHASSTRQPADAARTINYSAIARRLHIGDGGTVKTHLSRYQERFARTFASDDREEAEGSESSS